MQVFSDDDEGKQAITHYKVLEDFGYTSLIECKLETGRTHQIRVHLSNIKHPLFNDAMKTWGCLFLSGLAVSQKTTGKIFSAPEINFMQKFLTHGSQIEYQEVPNYGRMAIYLGNPSVQERDMCVKDLTNVINQGFIYSGNSNLSASLSGTGTPDFYIEMLYNKENAALDLPGGVHIPALYEDTHFRLLNSLREVIYDSDPCSKASSRISHSIYITDSNKEKK